MRITKRRQSQNMHFQKIWDYSAQSQASEISKHAPSTSLGLLRAEQHVGNLNKMHFQKLWDSCAQNKTSEISKRALSGILGLLCAEQNAGNQNKYFLNSEIPAPRTERRKYQKLHFLEFWDS